MDNRVKEFILNIKIDRKVAFENMTVFGLKLEGGNGFDYATLDEALERK